MSEKNKQAKIAEEMALLKPSKKEGVTLQTPNEKKRTTGKQDSSRAEEI